MFVICKLQLITKHYPTFLLGIHTQYFTINALTKLADVDSLGALFFPCSNTANIKISHSRHQWSFEVAGGISVSLV